ncbi:MAG: transglycosylase domain-containing protein [Treponema sp.]|nr:transglycosylase domain-containing protein [Treponema sp.]
MIVKRNSIIIIVITAAVIVVVWLLLRFSPYPELKLFIDRPYSIRYYDRNGELLQITALEEGLRREKPLLIPAQVKDVFVFAEDRRFFFHDGVDDLALLRALYQNIGGGRRVSGASTITMQLARLIANSSDQSSLRRQTLFSKIGEAVNAYRLEARLTKDEILELYLNSVPFGYNTEGVASAARTFYSAQINELSPAQIFALAVIPRRPSLYNPLDNPQNCIAAAAELQARFSKSRKLKSKWPLLAGIAEDDWLFAESSAMRFKYPFELPHLIRNINSRILSSGDLPENINNVTHNARTFSGETYLSVDLSLQHFIEGAIYSNVMRYYSSRLTNGAAVVIDNETGEILAWVGSADFSSVNTSGQIDGVLTLNQAGSSMKPFLYAMALENGFLPTDVLADVQMVFGENELYIPRNFNNRFNGPMLFRSALASSLNIPAVYLLYRLSVQNYTQKLLSLGFDSIEHSAQEAGLGLALGNAPVSLLELVRAFSVFPRDGVYLPVTWEKKEIPESGNDKSQDGNEQRIYYADTARLICSFLSDPGARVLAFGDAPNFKTSFPAMFKTGTANQFQSIVALGATPKYTAGVWMGNFTGETVVGRTGSSASAAITRDALTFLHESNRIGGPDFKKPESWQMRRVCAVSGMEPASACIAVINEYTRQEFPAYSCTWHQLINGRSETIYPAEYQAWFNSAVRQGSIDYASRPLEVISPRDGFVYLSSPGIGMSEIPVEVIGGSGDELHITSGGRSYSVKRPFVFYLPRVPGFHTLRVQNGDEEAAVSFTVEP